MKKKIKKVFLAAAIQSRNEETYEGKLNGAKKRIEEYILPKPRPTDWEYVNIFELCPDYERMHPHEFMRRSVELLKTCDIILFDFGCASSYECLEWYHIARKNKIKVREMMGEAMEFYMNEVMMGNL